MTTLLDPFADGELDAAGVRRVSDHLAGCARCANDLRRIRELGTAIRREMPALAAPDEVRAHVEAAIRAVDAGSSAASEARPGRGSARRRARWAWFPAGRQASLAAAALVVAAGAAWQVGRVEARSGAEDAAMRDAVVASHIRSLQAGHLLDVASTDRHTVKPWFNGRVDFSPTVVDFQAQGFPLLGGRLDYLDGRAVAALAYGRARHVISVFVWPVAASDPSWESSSSLNGYHVRFWRAGGMNYWAVSDVADADLDAFVGLLKGT